MAKIVINSKAELQLFQKKIRILRNVLPTLQKQALDKTANKDVLEQIHEEMRLNNFSEKIINATFVGKTERIGSLARTHFISNYVSETGFDVSKAREEGTANNILRRPKKEGGVLRWFAKSGEPIFRKFSRPKGIERLQIIEKTINKAQNEVATNYQSNLTAFVSKFLGV